MIVDERRHYRQGRQIESLDDCVAGDDVDKVEVTGNEPLAPTRKRVGRMGQGSRAQASGLHREVRKRFQTPLPFTSQPSRCFWKIQKTSKSTVVSPKWLIVSPCSG